MSSVKGEKESCWDSLLWKGWTKNNEQGPPGPWPTRQAIHHPGILPHDTSLSIPNWHPRVLFEELSAGRTSLTTVLKGDTVRWWSPMYHLASIMLLYSRCSPPLTGVPWWYFGFPGSVSAHPLNSIALKSCGYSLFVSAFFFFSFCKWLQFLLGKNLGNTYVCLHAMACLSTMGHPFNQWALGLETNKWLWFFTVVIAQQFFPLPSSIPPHTPCWIIQDK